MIEIVEKRQDWDNVLQQIGNYDFYHTYGYHRIMAKEGELPILIHYVSGDVQIAFPFLRRSVDGQYHDLTSVHGYLGPIGRGAGAVYGNGAFSSAFQELMVEEGIVSAFSKLNPFIRYQDRFLQSMGTIENIGELVYFDQTMEDAPQLSQYNRNTRQSLKKLQRLAYVREADGPGDIQNFIEIYHRTMDRLNANKIFYFDRDYFQELMESQLLSCKIWFAIHHETKDIIACAFATQTGEICHLELMGTNEAYFNLSPSRILYDHARATLKGGDIKYLVLGGGSGGREGSLMRFKASFTQNYADFRVWKYIAMPEAYASLLSESQRVSDTNFFPRYRASD